MGVDVLWLDAQGKRRAEVPDSSSTLSTAIQHVQEDPRQRNLAIATIDLYGTTRFSSGQAGRLFREFEALRKEASMPAERIALGHVLSILRAAEGLPDEWIEFVGD